MGATIGTCAVLTTANTPTVAEPRTVGTFAVLTTAKDMPRLRRGFAWTALSRTISGRVDVVPDSADPEAYFGCPDNIPDPRLPRATGVPVFG